MEEGFRRTEEILPNKIRVISSASSADDDDDQHFLSLPLSVDQKLSKSLEVHREGSAGNQPVLYKQSLPCPCPRGRINQMALSVLQ